MRTIEERAKEYAPDPVDPDCILPAREGYIVNQQRNAYIAGATEQKAIDIEKVCDWLSNYFVFEHEAMLAAGCDAFLRKLRKDLEE